MSDTLFPDRDCTKVEIDGVSVPEVFGTIDKEVEAVRYSAGISDISCVGVLRISGDHAYELTDRICPCFLHIRVNQMKHTLLLKEDGSPLADIYICKEQSGYIILGKGMQPWSTAILKICSLILKRRGLSRQHLPSRNSNGVSHTLRRACLQWHSMR